MTLILKLNIFAAFASLLFSSAALLPNIAIADDAKPTEADTSKLLPNLIAPHLANRFVLAAQVGPAWERSPEPSDATLPVPSAAAGISLLYGLNSDWAVEGILTSLSFWGPGCDDPCKPAGTSHSLMARLNYFVKDSFFLFAGPGLNSRHYKNYVINIDTDQTETDLRKGGELQNLKLNAGVAIGAGLKVPLTPDLILGIDILSVFLRPVVLAKPDKVHEDQLSAEDKAMVDRKADREYEEDWGRLGAMEMSLGYNW